MSKWRFVIAFGVVGYLTSVASPANAQIASSCLRIMLEYVGKPLAKAFAEKGAGMIADYFEEKMKGRQTSGGYSANATEQFTQQDLANLQAMYQQSGRTECELRQDLQQAYQSYNTGFTGNMPNYNSGYNMGYGQPTISIATVCMTQLGWCQLTMPTAPGNYCFCQGIPGLAQ